MTVLVRGADLEKDALAILEGAKDFIARMTYRSFLPETEEELVDVVSRIVSLDFVETWLAEQEGRVIGGIGLSRLPHLWNPKVTVVEELFWWTAPDAPPTAALALIRHAQERAKGCEAIFKNLQSSPKRIEKVYRRMGLVPVETSWMGRL